MTTATKQGHTFNQPLIEVRPNTATPGPWVLFDLDEENPGRNWSIVKGGPLAYLQTEPSDQGIANARLIAAAPELLEALEELNYRALVALGLPGDETLDVKRLPASPLGKAIAQARSAIARATGQGGGE